MRVYLEGQGYMEAPADLPLLVSFDPSRPYPARTGDNQGCPLGYLAQLRSDGVGGNVAVCRLATEEYMTDPQVRLAETGTRFTDYLVMVGGAFGQSVVQSPAVALRWLGTALRETAETLRESVLDPLLLYILLGLGGLYLWTRPRARANPPRRRRRRRP